MTAAVTATIGLLDHGGMGSPIVLLHGLMGRGRTWFKHIPWLRNYGRIFTFDASFHHGEIVDVPEEVNIETERFVADIAEILHWIDLGPATLIGHSMGALHAWCTASEYPELVSAIVVEDMVPEFPGQNILEWIPYFESWPQQFASREQCVDFFGAVAGEYFWTSFDNGRPHGSHRIWQSIAAAWGNRDFWHEWNSVGVPSLLLQGEYGIDIHGFMSTMARNPWVQAHVVVPGVGHLVHDENTAYYRGAVEAFLAGYV